MMTCQTGAGLPPAAAIPLPRAEADQNAPPAAAPAPSSDMVSLGAPTPPAPPPKPVRLSVNPQDPKVMSPSEVELPRNVVGNLSNSRIQIADKKPVPKPDANGNFLGTPGTRPFQQANAFAATHRTLTMFERELGHKIDWSFSGPLRVRTKDSTGLNAFYSKITGTLNFMGDKDKKTKEQVETSESFEIVSHEAGHATLDGLRPGMLGYFSPVEAMAFHEAFGDVAAMLTSLGDAQVLDHVVAQTGGDLRKDNVAARVGEQLSAAINHNLLNSEKPEGWTIRNANNTLKYKKPDSLPDNPADENQLGKEPHNFSRVWSGAMWDVMVAVASKSQADGATASDAIAKARDVLRSLTAHAVELSPDRLDKLSQMAAAMLRADARYLEGAYTDVLTRVFKARNIATAAADQTGVVEGVSLRPTKTPATPMEAYAWLATHRDQLTVPSDVPLTMRSLVLNDRGETFVTFDYVQEVPIGDRYCTDLGGAFTLGFEADGRVFHSMWEPVDADMIAQAEETIAGHLRRGEIRGMLDAQGRHAWTGSASSLPPVGEVDATPRAGALAHRIKLVRIPWAD